MAASRALASAPALFVVASALFGCRSDKSGADPLAGVTPIGPLDAASLDAYCKSTGATHGYVAAETNGWRCALAEGGGRDVDMNAACKLAHPDVPAASARQTTNGDANSWVCVKPKP